MYLSQYKSKHSLATTLFVLILITVFVIGADIWAIFMQKLAKEGRIAGFILIILEIAQKLVLLILLVAWKFRG